MTPVREGMRHVSRGHRPRLQGEWRDRPGCVYLGRFRMNPDKLFNYLEGKLSAAEREKLEDQLIRDPELQRQFAMARKIHDGMSGDAREVLLDEPPPGAARSKQLMRRIAIVF